MKLPTPLFPLDPQQIYVWKRLLRNQQRIAQAHETMARARLHLETVQRELGRESPLPLRP